MAHQLHDDRQANWKYETDWYSHKVFNGILSVAAAVDTSLGAGVGIEASIVNADAELCGMLVGADGDEWYLWMPIPSKWDMAYDLFARVFYFNGEAVASDPAWTIGYTFYGEQAVITDASAGTKDALITFPNRVGDDTIHVIEHTPWLSLDTVANYDSDDESISLAVACSDLGSAQAATADKLTFQGIEIRYFPTRVSATQISNLQGT